MVVRKVIQYHTDAKMDFEVWEFCKDTQEFDRMYCEAVAGSIENNIDTYGMDPEMSASFWTQRDADHCDYKLRALVRHFEAKFKESNNG